MSMCSWLDPEVSELICHDVSECGSSFEVRPCARKREPHIHNNNNVYREMQ